MPIQYLIVSDFHSMKMSILSIITTIIKCMSYIITRTDIINTLVTSFRITDTSTPDIDQT